MHPRWRRDGREILYYAADNWLMAVPVKLEPSFEAGSAIRLFPTCLNAPPPFYSGGFELAENGTTLWLCPGNRSQRERHGRRRLGRRADTPTESSPTNFSRPLPS